MTARSALLAALLLSALPLPAQDAARTMDRLRDSMQRRALNTRVEQMRRAETAPKPQAEPDDAEPAPSPEEAQPLLPLRRLDIAPSRVLPAALIEGLRQQWEGKTLSVADIRSIVRALNKAYHERGCITSRAWLPEQDVSSGSLRVELFEGSIGRVHATGMHFTPESYVLRAAQLPEGEVFCVDDIESRLVAFNAVSDLKARLNISPGDAAGKTDLELVTEEPQRYSALLFTDNAGQRSTGLYRGGLFGTARGLLAGRYTRDQLTLGYVGSEGTDAFSAAYMLTENFLNTTWTLGVDRAATDIITDEMRELNVEGDYKALRAGVRRPLAVNERNILSAGLQMLFKENESTMSGLDLSSYRTNDLTATLDDLLLFRDGYLYNAAMLTRGWQLVGSEPPFWRFNYQLEFRHKLPHAFSALLRGQYQASSLRAMTSSEQIQLGGVNSIRGYEEGMLCGERGYSLQSELSYNFLPLLPQRLQLHSAELFAFWDFGQLVHRSEDALLRDDNEAFLSSVGGGLRLGLLQHLSMSLTFAQPLHRHPLNRHPSAPRWLYALNAEF